MGKIINGRINRENAATTKAFNSVKIDQVLYRLIHSLTSSPFYLYGFYPVTGSIEMTQWPFTPSLFL